MYVHNNCAAIFKENTTVTFYNNTATTNGGAIFFKMNSNLTFGEISKVAKDTDGAISSETISEAHLEDNFHPKSPAEFNNATSLHATSSKDNISSANLK